jgi:hypothetical protein
MVRARCHVIGTAKPHGGIDSTPTFLLMNEKLPAARAAPAIIALP